MWTRFLDMHSGGGLKEPPYWYIYIELPEDEAKIYFYNRFGHNPERVTCTCCGDDYSIRECVTLKEATKFERREISLNEFMLRKDILVIENKDIEPGMTKGEIPDQGY